MEYLTPWPGPLFGVVFIPMNSSLGQNQVPALSVENVVKTFGQVEALKGIRFTVGKGEVFGLLGPNGAGKTSLISIIVTLERATQGVVRVFGHDVASDSRDSKYLIGWVPQEVINHGYFNVEEILGFQAGYYGLRKPKERIDYLLHGLGLYEHRLKKVRQLSGGMRRRLMIAKALVHSPSLLLLDEPTAGVDVELRMKLWDFVEQQRREGLSILLTTHYLEEAERLCDRVAIIDHGKIRALDRTRVLIEQWSRKRMILKLVEPITSLSHPDLVSGANKEWVFNVPMQKSLGQLLHEVRIPSDQLQDVQVFEGRLEDVFMNFTRQEVQA
jgi:ABC-2 type transport system ATP-binding protein